MSESLAAGAVPPGTLAEIAVFEIASTSLLLLALFLSPSLFLPLPFST